METLVRQKSPTGTSRVRKNSKVLTTKKRQTKLKKRPGSALSTTISETSVTTTTSTSPKKKNGKVEKASKSTATSNFDRLSDVIRAGLGVAIKKYKLYGNIRQHYFDEEWDETLDFVKQNLGSTPEKALLAILRDVDEVYTSQQNMLLGKPTRDNNKEDENSSERAETSR